MVNNMIIFLLSFLQGERAQLHVERLAGSRSAFGPKRKGGLLVSVLV